MSFLTLGEGTASASISDSATVRLDLSARHGEGLILVVSSPTHVRLGGAATAATTADFRLPADWPIELVAVPGADHVCMICPSGGSATAWICERRKSVLD